MIPGITEINFPQYATLHEATVSLSEMGERTISTQVRIDGDIVPSFDGWELEFKGERFVLPIKEPQAAKDNTTRNSLIDLTFYSWPILQMKRYFFVKMAEITAGTAVADLYVVPMRLNVSEFTAALNQVLDYYFDGDIVAELYQDGSVSNSERFVIEINYSYIWDVLQKVYEIYGETWYIAYESGVYKIKIGYPADEIDDHEFEYGYKGGLLRFERQVQDDNITNILLGRGGERNLPYRYFKRVDPENPDWAPDPDAIPELANIYFDRLRDYNFRCYIEGWRTNPNRDTSWEGVQPYDSTRAATDWAYKKGHTDTKFNPTEYVKDDTSIQKYGEHWGAVDNNDDIYPTIQGISRSPIGRVDQTVAVSEILSDDINAAAAEGVQEINIEGVEYVAEFVNGHSSVTKVIQSDYFDIEVPAGKTANVEVVGGPFATVNGREMAGVYVDDPDGLSITLYDTLGVAHSPSGITSGSYRYEITITAENDTASRYLVSFGVNGLKYVLSDDDSDAWKPTFDIWVKNIWDTTPAAGETNDDYSLRVWYPILGDRVGNEAKIAFSSGFMSMSEDYEFTIVDYPVVDRTKTINGVPSEWKITLRKSDAEFEATGKYIPSADGGKPIAGDYFYFLGIDMPFDYVKWAEQELTTYKEKQLSGMSETNPTWVIQLDKVRVHTIEDGDYNERLADRLATGAMVKTKDKRFTNDQVLNLYVRSITYTWTEPTEDDPHILPDIEVVLSDSVSTEMSPVQKVQSDIQTIKSTYIRSTDLEAVVRRVSTPLFLRKTGEADNSNSPTTFANKVTSRSFRKGAFGGEGWGFFQDGEENDCLEIDRIIVRKELQVNNLVINQVSYVGGKRIISAAAMECVQVLPVAGGYKCFFDQKQGSIKNLFVIGDIALGQRFNTDNTQSKYYKRVVTAVDVDSITLSETFADGIGVPEEGDTIVQFGHISNTDRQYVIITDVIGGGYEQMLCNLTVDENDEFTDGDEYYFAGRTSGQNNGAPRFFVGDKANGTGYMEYIVGTGLVLYDHFVESGMGPVKATAWCGPWVSDRVYKKNDEVTHTRNGLTSSYVYINDTPSYGHEPPDSTTPPVYWEVKAAGQKGDPGAPGSPGANGQGTVTSIVFKRSVTKPQRPSGGSYSHPVPSDWSDGIPSGTDQLWRSQRIFTSDGLSPQEAQWSDPIEAESTADLQTMYCNWTGSGYPPDPGQYDDDSELGPTPWHSPAQEGDNFMAILKLINGVPSDEGWEVLKIKGEAGTPGTPGTPGATGKGVASTESYYLISETATTQPAEDDPSWSPTCPTGSQVIPGYYVWQKTRDIYTDGTYGPWRYDWWRSGANGANGLQGPATLYMGLWQEDLEYYADYERCDIVYFEWIDGDKRRGEYFIGNPTWGKNIPRGTAYAPVVGTAQNWSFNTQYWMRFGKSFDTVAAGWIFAERATFENAVVRRLYTSDVQSASRIIIEGQTMTMYSNGAQRLQITGENLDPSPYNGSTTAVSNTIYTASLARTDILDGDYEDFTYNLSVKDFTSPSNDIKSDLNVLSLPQIPLTLTMGIGNPAISGVEVWGQVCWLVDSEEYMPTSIYGVIGEDESSAQGTATLPAHSLSLSKGDHTVKIRIHFSITAAASETDWTNLSVNILSDNNTHNVVLAYTDQSTAIGANGFMVRFADNYMFSALKTGEQANTVQFLMRAGNYGIRVYANGADYTNDGGTTWSAIGSGGGTPSALSLQLNGAAVTPAATAAWYAPTGAGTSGQTLISQGSGAPQWGSYAGSASQAFAVSSLSIGSGSSLSVSSGVLSVTGNAGVSLDDATHGSALLYSNGKFESDTNDDLGSASAPWGDVWANAFYVDYDMVNGEPWPIGFRYNSQSSYFELIGPTYFYGGDFLPMSSYQGNAVTKTLGNMYFWWDYAFVRNVIFNRDGNNINRGLSWDGNNNRVNANVAIRTTANLYVDGTLNIGGASLYYDDEDGKIHSSAEIVVDEQ